MSQEVALMTVFSVCPTCQQTIHDKVRWMIGECLIEIQKSKQQ